MSTGASLVTSKERFCQARWASRSLALTPSTRPGELNTELRRSQKEKDRGKERKGKGREETRKGRGKGKETETKKEGTKKCNMFQLSVNSVLTLC